MKQALCGLQRHLGMQSQQSPSEGSSPAYLGGDITLSSEWHSRAIETDVSASTCGSSDATGDVSVSFEVSEHAGDFRRFEAGSAVVQSLL